MRNQECSQCVFQMLVNLHNGGLVAAAVTVIWCCSLVNALVHQVSSDETHT